MIRSVLVPADFSPEFNLVAALADGLPALGVERVVLGHIVKVTGMDDAAIAEEVDSARDAIGIAAQPFSRAGLDVEVRIGTGGDLADELIGLAAETHVDAIVAGSHGKSRVERLRAGSVSEDVLVNAELPALMVRYALLNTAHDPADLLRTFGRTLVLTTDFSEGSTRAFQAVLDLPVGTVSTLFIVHALDPGLEGDELREAREVAEDHLRALVTKAGQKRISARPVVRQGVPAQVALSEIEDRRATGVVAGTRGRGALSEEGLGSVSLSLVRQAFCPVLIVH